LLPVGEHLRQLEKRHPETPLADRLLAEIEADNRLLAEIEAEETAKSKTKKTRRLPSQPESKEPGITPGDVFRIFGNGARTILMETDWQGAPETDRRAISEEAARWVFNDAVFFNDGQWHRAITASNNLAGKRRHDDQSDSMKTRPTPEDLPMALLPVRAKAY
jgi:hypothetical protein